MRWLPILFLVIAACGGGDKPAGDAAPANDSAIKAPPAKADSTSASTAEGGTAGVTHVASPATSDQLQDLLGATDALVRDARDFDVENVLKSSAVEETILEIERTNKVNDKVVAHEECTDMDLHFRVYGNGLVEETRGDDPILLSLTGESMEVFGVTHGDSPVSVMARLGKPRKLTDECAYYVSDQPSEEFEEIFPNLWDLYVVFENGGAQRILLSVNREDC